MCVFGLGYTAVMLEDGSVGVAYTFRDNAAAGCSVFMGRRSLAGRTTTGIITVTDGPGILQIVSEGGGMGFFGRRIRKVNVRL